MEFLPSLNKHTPVATMIARLSLLCIVLAAFHGTSAFAPAPAKAGFSTARGMAPKFDPTTQRWIPQNDEEATPAYGPLGELMDVLKDTMIRWYFSF